MDVITTHINADFDCLGSMIAAKRLYPDAEMVFPGGQERSLREFYLKSAQYLYGFKRVKDINLADIDRLILVDVRQASRIGPFAKVARRKAVEVHIYDHHPAKPGSLVGDVEHMAPVGATVTVLTHLFMERGIVPSPDEATMMMLGLYEDTGNLTFHTTTTSDYQAAAYLLEHGANLNVVSDFMVQDLTPDQVRLLNDLIASQSILNVQGIDITIAHASVDYFVGDIATLVHKLKDMENLDVLFVAVRVESRVFMIARSRLDEVHVGEILAEFGGGGHASAASGTVRDQTLLQILERLPQVLQRHVHPQWQVRHLMSSPVKTVGLHESTSAAHQILSRFNINAIPVVERTKVVGIMTRQLVDKAMYHQLSNQPVSEFMTRDFHCVQPDTPVDILKSLIVESNQRFVPVTDHDALIGAVTRTDLLRHLASSSGAHPRSGGQGLASRGGKVYKANQIQRLIRHRLPERIQQIFVRLGKTADQLGVNVFVVGGFVRDLLLDVENLDLDIVVEGDGIAFAETFAKRDGCRIRCHRKFGTAVVIYADDFKLDIASARMEYYLHPGALPDVEHASVKMDLYRRDFTINTLAVTVNQKSFGELLDYYGGQRDISEKAIRVLHNLSFVEDPTRVFRAVRFEQRLGFKIGKQTEHLLRSAVRLGLLDKISGKRIFNELRIIFNERTPLSAIKRLQELDLLKAVHAALGRRFDYPQLFEETKRAMDWYDLLYTGRPCKSWLCYFLAFSAPLDRAGMLRLSERLQIPNRYCNVINEQRHEGLAVLRRLERRTMAAPPRSSTLYRWLKPLDIELLIFLMALTSKDYVRQWISRYITHLRDVKPLLNGRDLESLGVRPGPIYKDLLTELLNAQLDGRATTVEAQKRLVRLKRKKN